MSLNVKNLWSKPVKRFLGLLVSNDDYLERIRIGLTQQQQRSFYIAKPVSSFTGLLILVTKPKLTKGEIQKKLTERPTLLCHYRH